MKLRVVLCGGGALAHCLGGVIGADRDVQVVMLTQRPGQWSNHVLVRHGAHVVAGAIAATDDPAVIGNAHLALVAAPAFAHAPILARLVPHLRPGCWVGALPAVGGFDGLVRSLAPRHRRVLGALRAPYNARVIGYGRAVEVFGVAPRLDVVCAPGASLAEAVDLVGSLLGLPVRGVAPFLLATLFHPARIHELLLQADVSGQRFYADWGDEAGRAYLAMDAELAALRAALGCDLPGLDALGHYGVGDAAALAQRIRALAGLPDVDIPFAHGRLDRTHRFVREDLPFGLGIARRYARRCGIPAPVMARVFKTIQAALG